MTDKEEIVSTNEVVTTTEATNTSEVVKESETETHTETDDETIKDDEIEDTEDDDSDEEVEDKEEKSTDNKNTKKQSRKDNEKYAQMRREKRERERKEAYYNGIKAVTGETNPYTNEKMETQEDVEDYLLMKEMEKKGLDPNSTIDYRKYKKQVDFEKKEQERVAQETEQKLAKESKARQEKEYKEFLEKYKDVDLKKVLEKDGYSDTMKALIGSGKTLTEAYETCNKLANATTAEQAKKLAEKQAKIAKTEVSSQSDEGSSTGAEAWKDLKVGTKEFDAYVEKVKRGLIK